MTKARNIIQGCLTFHLNRLSPGETLDADLAATCLAALNHIADELNGGKSFLFREIRTSAPVTGASGTLGSTWNGLAPGDKILGATYNDGSQDVPMHELTFEQYSDQIPLKGTSGQPYYWTHDGLATVYLFPAATGQTVTLRTKQAVSDLADLDTDYSMPKGYESALAAVLAEKLAPVLLGNLPTTIVRAAGMARSRMQAQASKPAIINARGRVGNILVGW